MKKANRKAVPVRWPQPKTPGDLIKISCDRVIEVLAVERNEDGSVKMAGGRVVIQLEDGAPVYEAPLTLRAFVQHVVLGPAARPEFEGKSGLAKVDPMQAIRAAARIEQTILQDEQDGAPPTELVLLRPDAELLATVVQVYDERHPWPSSPVRRCQDFVDAIIAAVQRR